MIRQPLALKRVGLPLNALRDELNKASQQGVAHGWDEAFSSFSVGLGRPRSPPGDCARESVSSDGPAR